MDRGFALQENCTKASMLGGQMSRPSALEQLKNNRQYLAQQLADHDAAIEALEQNPEVTKVLELLAKVGR